MLQKFSIHAGLIYLLSACAIWPPQGTGGQAEDFELTRASGSPLRLENQARLECYHSAIQALSVSRAAQQHPAHVQVLSILWNRAIRAHVAQLDLETADDLSQLEQSHHSLQSQLQENKNFITIATDHSTRGTCS